MENCQNFSLYLEKLPSGVQSYSNSFSEAGREGEKEGKKGERDQLLRSSNNQAVFAVGQL